MKKAQSISINTIIVAAIALLVLVVITVIFSSNIRDWIRGVDNCAQKEGGQCTTLTAGQSCTSKMSDGNTYASLPGTDCEDTGQTCCYLIY